MQKDHEIDPSDNDVVIDPDGQPSQSDQIVFDSDHHFYDGQEVVYNNGVERILNATGVRFHPRDLTLSQADLESALLTLRTYVESEHLPHSVINERPIDPATVRELCHDLQT
jgi:hypothetical protein